MIGTSNSLKRSWSFLRRFGLLFALLATLASHGQSAGPQNGADPSVEKPKQAKQDEQAPPELEPKPEPEPEPAPPPLQPPPAPKPKPKPAAEPDIPESGDDITGALEEADAEEPPAEPEPPPPPKPEPEPEPKPKQEPEPEPEPEPKPAAKPDISESGEDITGALEEAGKKDEPPAKPDVPESGEDVTGALEEADETDVAEPEAPTEKQPVAKPDAPESGEDVTSELEKAKAEDVRETVEQEKVAPEKESGENVTGKLEEARKPATAGSFPRGPISELYNAWDPFRKQLREDTGLAVGLAYTSLLQVATSGETRTGMSGDADLFGKWTPPAPEETDRGALGFLVEQRHRMASITPRDLGDEFGALWDTTQAFNTRNLSVVQLWWEQYLLEDHLRLTVGKLSVLNFYNGNAFQNQNAFFLNRAFSSNPARSFPQNGFGVNARVVPAADVYVSAGVHDTNGSATTVGFSDFDSDELFYAAEIGFTPEIEGLGKGRYRFTYWYTGAGDSSFGESGGGFALSFEQHLSENVVPFFRYGYQDRELTAVRQIVAGGVGITNPLGRKDDVFGVSAAWGQPVDRSLRDEKVVECFYRMQVTPKLQLTPGYQLIFDPSLNTTETNLVGVFQLRFRLVF